MERRDKEVAELKQRVLELAKGEQGTEAQARARKAAVAQKQNRVDALEAKVAALEAEGKEKDARLEKLKRAHARDKADAQCWRIAGDKIGQPAQPGSVGKPVRVPTIQDGGGLASMVEAGEARERAGLDPHRPPPAGALRSPPREAPAAGDGLASPEHDFLWRPVRGSVAHCFDDL